MVRVRWPRVWAVVVLGGMVPACGPRVPVEELPTAGQTLAAVGQRLRRSHSPEGMRWIADRGYLLLKLLSPEERDALGRNGIRFRVDRPAFIEVAAPADAVPFWLEEQGFADSHQTLDHADGPFVIYHKYVRPGWVGLGVNGLDAAPRSHYAAFVLPRDEDQVPMISGLSPATVRPVRATDGVSSFVDVHRPFGKLPPLFQGATLLQTSFARRGATALAVSR